MSSFKTDSSSSIIVNSNELRTKSSFKAPSPDHYTNWTIPKIDVDNIYKIGTFDFKTAYSVKTHEEVVAIQNGLQTISLINQNSM